MQHLGAAVNNAEESGLQPSSLWTLSKLDQNTQHQAPGRAHTENGLMVTNEGLEQLAQPLSQIVVS